MAANWSAVPQQHPEPFGELGLTLRPFSHSLRTLNTEQEDPARWQICSSAHCLPHQQQDVFPIARVLQPPAASQPALATTNEQLRQHLKNILAQ